MVPRFVVVVPHIIWTCGWNLTPGAQRTTRRVPLPVAMASVINNPSPSPLEHQGTPGFVTILQSVLIGSAQHPPEGLTCGPEGIRTPRANIWTPHIEGLSIPSGLRGSVLMDSLWCGSYVCLKAVSYPLGLVARPYAPLDPQVEWLTSPLEPEW